MPPRRSSDRVVSGVCGGLAEELDVEPMVFRTLYTTTFVLFGLGVPLYLGLYFWMEPNPSDAETAGPSPATA